MRTIQRDGVAVLSKLKKAVVREISHKLDHSCDIVDSVFSNDGVTEVDD